jgi:ABC-type branched-subunit amino acid transport system ATPase component
MAAAILGLAPALGDICLDGQPLPATPEARRRRGLAGVLDPPRLVPDLRLEDHLRLAPHPPRARAIFSALLPDAPARRKVPAGRASGGERRLLAHALALCDTPSLLVLEEARTGLAPGAISQLQDLLQTYIQRGGAVLFVGPSLPLALGTGVTSSSGPG